MNFEKIIINLLSSNTFLICIQTKEEERLEYTLNYISQKNFQKNIYTWDFIDGYKNTPKDKKLAEKNPLKALEIIQTYDKTTKKIFLLKDFENFVNDINIIRKLKNLNQWLKNTNTYIIISCINIEIPISLREYISFINFDLPNKKEILIEINRIINIINIQNIEKDQLASIYQGFSIYQIRKSIAKIIFTNVKIEDIIKNIIEEKKEIIQQTNILDFYTSSYKLLDIGGLKNLKNWLKKRSYGFSINAKNYGIPQPKGILLVGIQGTGKSLSAQAIALEWNLPLLKLDIGKIFAGIVGESENRMRQMIQLTEKMAPCILWIDEIDKIFTKYNNNNDSGTTNRVINGLITWLSEKNNSVFIVATANNILDIKTEILRKGRFDEIFFLDLPNFEERLNIFKIHLKKLRPLNWHKYNIYYLSQITYKFSGAEIKQSIIEAMYDAFYESREFNTRDIANAISELIPLAFVDESTIHNLQQLAKDGKVRLA
uniref:Uncharacterized AAA domain-containing protein ycf46 n=1 Tax=Compsothamnion thuioides TaxID=3097386 RepID=A0A4D6WN89_9FLOR|nr:hypothetical protein [Compsothamnion thuyoides]